MKILILAIWILSAVTHITDKRGNHFLARQMPRAAADAFAKGCANNNPFPNDGKGQTCVGFLTVMAALESGFDLHIAGDCVDKNPEHPEVCDEAHHPLARGPFQEHTGGDDRTRSWDSTTRHYLWTVKNVAMRTCPEEPIASLAGERCGDSPTHRWRWAQVQRLLQEVPYEE